MGDHEVPAVRVMFAGHVDLWASEEQEDKDSDDEPRCCDHNEFDGTYWRQFPSSHDEASTEAAQRTGQRPRQRCTSQSAH